MRNTFLFDSPVMSFLNKLTNLVILNLCFFVSCIPIVTIGAAITALYSVNLRMVKGEESYVFSSYWKAFCSNFKKATIGWGIMALLLAVLLLDVYAVQILEGGIGIFFTAVTLFFAVIYGILFLYVFPYIGWFEDRLSVCFKNAFMIGGSNIGYTITVFLITLAFLAVSVFDMEIMLRLLIVWIVWIVFGVALLNYIQSYFLRKVFSKYENSEEKNLEL